MATPKQSPIIPLFFEDNPVRVIDRDNVPWFLLIDVCRAIEHSNPSQAAASLDDDEKDSITLSDGTPGNPTKLVINEGGLYSLILRSNGATTPGTVQHRFRKWVTAEVLPAIRKTGAYIAPKAKPLKSRADEINLAYLQELVDTQSHLIKTQSQLFDKLHREREAYISTEIVRHLVKYSDLDDQSIAEIAKSEAPYVAYVRETTMDLTRPPV